MNTDTNTQGNLDITQVPNEDPEKLASCIETFYKNDTTIKARLSYNWDRNHRFLDGDQWLVFSGDPETGGMWNRLTVSKPNEYIPRPVTNYIFDCYQTLKSYIIKTKPRITVFPNTQNYRDKAAAKIANLCSEANYERLNEQENYEYAAACLLIDGTVFKKSYWDTSAANSVTIPKMQQVPQVDPMTGDVLGYNEEQEIDPLTGEPAVESLPLGDVNTDVVESYRIALDPLATGLHKARWIMEYSIQSLDWIKETYGKQEEGYTGLADTVKEERSLSGSLARFYNLKNSSGVRAGMPLDGTSTGRSFAPITNSAVVKEYYEKPCSKYPNGRMVVVANNVTLYAGATPYEGPELGDWHPYSECRWEIVPGRFWGKSPLDAACEIQKRINSIDAVMILTRKTMAIPQKLVPTTAGIPPGSWTGRPGQQIPWSGRDGAKPEIIPGVGVDPTVFKEREQCVDDLKSIMGALDILKGDRPPGVNAASALSLLYEVGTGKLFPALDRWKRFIEQDQKKQLRLIAKNYREPRPDYIRILKMKNKELSEESIDKFIGEDLYDNCNVIVEAGSNVPKLQAAMQSRLMEAAQVGVLALDQPANRMEFNRQMGITGFDNDVEPDVKRQEWENDLLDNADHSQDNMPIVLAVDDDATHMEVMARRMKEPSFMELSQTCQQAYMQHYQEHMDAKNQKEQADAMQAAANGQAAQPQQSANSPQPISGQGKGISVEQQKGLRVDATVPGG